MNLILQLVDDSCETTKIRPLKNFPLYSKYLPLKLHSAIYLYCFNCFCCWQHTSMSSLVNSIICKRSKQCLAQKVVYMFLFTWTVCHHDSTTISIVLGLLFNMSLEPSFFFFFFPSIKLFLSYTLWIVVPKLHINIVSFDFFLYLLFVIVVLCVWQWEIERELTFLAFLWSELFAS